MPGASSASVDSSPAHWSADDSRHGHYYFGGGFSVVRCSQLKFVVEVLRHPCSDAHLTLASILNSGNSHNLPDKITIPADLFDLLNLPGIKFAFFGCLHVESQM